MVPAEGARLTVSGYITLLVTVPRVVRRMLLVWATLRRRYGVMALSGVKISELLMVNITYHTLVSKYKQTGYVECRYNARMYYHYRILIHNYTSCSAQPRHQHMKPPDC